MNVEVRVQLIFSSTFCGPCLFCSSIGTMHASVIREEVEPPVFAQELTDAFD